MNTYKPIVHRKPVPVEDPAIVTNRLADARLHRCRCINCRLGNAEQRLYFIRDVDVAIVKIGVTHIGVIAGKRRTVDDRRRQLELLGCRQLLVMKHVRGSRAMEIGLHEQLDEFRIKGEWFRLTTYVANYIENFDGRIV
jgi:hypothetical protein